MAMGAVNTQVSLLVLLMVYLHIAPSLAGSDEEARLSLPEHQEGQPFPVQNFVGEIPRQKGNYQTLWKNDNYIVYIVAALAITGLSLLFPDTLTINTTSRRRRETETEKVEVGGMTEYLLGVYQKAIESDLCIQRLACKLGAASTSLKPHHQKLVLRLLGYVTSSRYSNLFTKFKAGVNEEKCETFGCSVIDKK